MRDKVTVKLQGGLGNQLFQYSAGKYFAEKQNFKLVLDLSLLGKNTINHGEYLFDMVHDNKVKTIRNGEIKYQFYRIIRKFYNNSSIFTYISNLFGFFFCKEIGYVSSLERKVVRHIDGYFQTWKYFNSLSKEIRDLFFVESEKENFKDLKNYISANRVLCIHVRQGDYKLVEKIYGLLSVEYYSKALGFALNKSKFSHIFVFSDEISRAREILNDLLLEHKVVWIGEDSELTPPEILVLMSGCNGIILANSTFSYWAALLSSNETLVIAPSIWYKSMNEPHALVPQNWKRISSFWT